LVDPGVKRGSLEKKGWGDGLFGRGIPESFAVKGRVRFGWRAKRKLGVEKKDKQQTKPRGSTDLELRLGERGGGQRR